MKKYNIYGCVFNVLGKNEILISELEKSVGTFWTKADCEFDFEFEMNLECLETTECVAPQSAEHGDFYIDYIDMDGIWWIDSDGTVVMNCKGVYLFSYNLERREVVLLFSNAFLEIANSVIELLKRVAIQYYFNCGKVAVHSSCIYNKKNNEAMLYVADSGSGKSSLGVLAEDLKDWVLLSDELNFVNEQSMVLPVMDSIKICHEMLYMREKRIKENFIVSNYSQEKLLIRRKDNTEVRNIKISKMVFLVRDDCLNDNCYRKATLNEYTSILYKNIFYGYYFDQSSRNKLLKSVNSIIKGIKKDILCYPTKNIEEASRLSLKV